MFERKNNGALKSHRRWVSMVTLATSLLLHGCGVALVFLAAAAPFMTEDTALGVFALHADAQLGEATSVGILFHLAASVLLWASLVVIWQAINASRTRPRRIVCASSGAVLIETVVVLPVMLTLIFGLSQIVLNNIARTVVNVAVFQAARTAWIWDNEVGVDGKGESDGPEDERTQHYARIQAAMVLAPVAVAPKGVDDSNPSSDRLAAMGMIFALQVPSLILENQASAGAERAGNAVGDSESSPLSNDYASALGGARPFSVRSVIGMSAAYHSLFTDASASTEGLNITRSNDEISVSFSYLHHQDMPLVRKMLGTEFTVDAVGGTGYFVPMSGRYTTRRQAESNRRAILKVDDPVDGLI
jgi:hypothetical protein